MEPIIWSNLRISKNALAYLKTMLLGILVSEISAEGDITEVRYDYFPAPDIFCGCNLSRFGLFLLGSTRFLQSFGGMGQNRKYEFLY